jgi:undecaprenyl-diphosphatase
MNALIGTLSLADERLLLAFLQRRRPVLDVLMRGVTKGGNPTAIIPIALTLALGVLPELHDPGIVAAWSLASSHALVHLLKRKICRPRPSLPIGLSSLIEPEDLFSFPSGHAAAGLSVALPVFLATGGPIGVVVLALGLAVGVSRCYLGVHYPGDVLVGWSLAGGTVVGVTVGFALI